MRTVSNTTDRSTEILVEYHMPLGGHEVFFKVTNDGFAHWLDITGEPSQNESKELISSALLYSSFRDGTHPEIVTAQLPEDFCSWIRSKADVNAGVNPVRSPGENRYALRRIWRSKSIEFLLQNMTTVRLRRARGQVIPERPILNNCGERGFKINELSELVTSAYAVARTAIYLSPGVGRFMLFWGCFGWAYRSYPALIVYRFSPGVYSPEICRLHPTHRAHLISPVATKQTPRACNIFRSIE